MLMLIDVSSTLAVVIFRDKIVETSVNINKKSPSQDFTNLDDLHLQTCSYTPGLEIDNIGENI